MNDCDEGGEHIFKRRKETGCCGWIGRILCCPCAVFCSCALAGGAAGASQATRGRADYDDNGEPQCTKCGLTYEESKALSDARQMEMRGARTSRGPNYFSNNGMSLPPSPTPSHGRQPSSGHRSAVPSPNPRSSNGGEGLFVQKQQQQHGQRSSQYSQPPSPRNHSSTHQHGLADPSRPEDEAVGNWLAGVRA